MERGIEPCHRHGCIDRHQVHQARVCLGDCGRFPHEAGNTTTVLAHRADAAVFGAYQPSESEVKEYWEIVDSSLTDITGSVGFWKRQQARFSPRSLLSDGRAALRRRKQDPSNPGGRRLKLPFTKDTTDEQ